MTQTKPHGVQEIAVDRNRLLESGSLLHPGGGGIQEGKNHMWRAVERVTYDRMSDRGKMDTNLMGTSGLDLNFD